MDSTSPTTSSTTSSDKDKNYVDVKDKVEYERYIRSILLTDYNIC